MWSGSCATYSACCKRAANGSPPRPSSRSVCWCSALQVHTDCASPCGWDPWSSGPYPRTGAALCFRSRGGSSQRSEANVGWTFVPPHSGENFLQMSNLFRISHFVSGETTFWFLWWVSVGETSWCGWKGHWNVARDGQCWDSSLVGGPWSSCFPHWWGSCRSLHSSEDPTGLNQPNSTTSQTQMKIQNTSTHQNWKFRKPVHSKIETQEKRSRSQV